MGVKMYSICTYATADDEAKADCESEINDTRAQFELRGATDCEIINDISESFVATDTPGQFQYLVQGFYSLTCDAPQEDTGDSQ